MSFILRGGHKNCQIDADNLAETSFSLEEKKRKKKKRGGLRYSVLEAFKPRSIASLFCRLYFENPCAVRGLHGIPILFRLLS